MVKANCLKCGEVLLFGKEVEDINWCPKCEGVLMDSVETTRILLKRSLSDTHKNLMLGIKGFNKESLAIAVYITREGMINSLFLESNSFVAYTELLKLIIEKGSVEGSECDPFSNDFQELLNFAEAFNESKILTRLLTSGWIRTIKVPRKDIPKYGYRVEDTVKFGRANDNFEGDGLETIIKFTSRWSNIKENFEKNGFFSKTDKTMMVAKGESRPSLVSEFWAGVKIKVLLDLGTGDLKALAGSLQKRIHEQNILQHIRVLEKVVENYASNFSAKQEKGWKKFRLEPIKLDDLFYPYVRQGLSLEMLMDFFVSSLFEFKMFGGMLLTSKGIFAGCQTLRIISYFLKGKYYKDYLAGQEKIGEEFEGNVVKELEKNDFCLLQPNDCTRKLINIKDDDEKPNLEIDILAEFRDELYVIECKSIVISTSFLSKNRETKVKKRLNKESAKQRKRIQYVKDNMELFGFDSNRIKAIHNIVVTYNKEPLKEYGDIRIVSIGELDLLKGGQ